MKKSILYSLLLASACLTTSCEDNKDEYLDDFSTILYFRNSGEVEHILYKPDATGTYVVSVVKAGSDLQSGTDVDVKLMDAGMLAAYNQSAGTNYKFLPANCYSMEVGKKSLDASHLYQTIDISMQTALVDALQEAGEIDNCVIPLYLSNSADSINVEKKVIFVHPKVVTPLVGFEKAGYVMNTFSESDAAERSFALPVTLSVKNKWTFDARTKVNEASLNAYNEQMGANFILLPEGSYSIANNGVVGMAPATDSRLNVTIQKASLSYGNYILPIQFTGTSNPKIGVDPVQEACLFGVSYVPATESLTRVALTPSMISFHPEGICEGSVEGMLDDKSDTYYHSNWEVGVPLPHYIQFALPETCSAFRLEYETINRDNSDRVVPNKVSIHGSADGVAFKKIVTLADIPTQVRKKFTSPVFVAGREIKYIRYVVEEVPARSFALAEFKLWVK